MSQNNCNNCNNDPCGCKLSTDEVVYKGPALECLGIENCDTLTVAFGKVNDLVCSPELVQIIVNNISNNENLLLQFTQIVNQNLDCDTVFNCLTTTTTLI
jgi:hypothetical protein